MLASPPALPPATLTAMLFPPYARPKAFPPLVATETLDALPPFPATGWMFFIEAGFFSQAAIGKRGRYIQWPGELDFCADALCCDKSCAGLCQACSTWRLGDDSPCMASA